VESFGVCLLYKRADDVVVVVVYLSACVVVLVITFNLELGTVLEWQPIFEYRNDTKKHRWPIKITY